MKGIYLMITLATLLSISSVSARGLIQINATTPEQQFCLDNNHTLTKQVYSFGTYWYCSDGYTNVCDVISYYLGTCKLVESWSAYDEKEYLFGLGDNFNKQVIQCKLDNDCTIATSTKCPCNSGGNQIAVNQKGLAY